MLMLQDNSVESLHFQVFEMEFASLLRGGFRNNVSIANMHKRCLATSLPLMVSAYSYCSRS